MDKVYAIIDIETTGGRANRDKITEIAIILHNGSQITDTYQTLINPETPIPYSITELTGITNEMVAHAPKFFEVAKDIVELTESAIFVAHNVRFDYSFIQEEFKRLGYTYSRRQLCTVRLSRKAFPGHSSYSLGNLIQMMNLKAGDRHRAMGDAMATVDLFERILALEQSENEIRQMVNLGVKESLLPKNFSLEKLHSLPEDCGVYYFHDERGDVVYVGKSLNIKKRVAEHFSVKTEKAAKMQQSVHDVSWEVTGSELVALLLESHEIKRLRPAINRAQKTREYPYVLHSWHNQAGYFCFDVAKNTSKTRKQLNAVATFPKLAQAKGWLSIVQVKYKLCKRHCHLENRSGACFDYHLNFCKGACIGKEAPEAYNERAQLALEELNDNLLEPNFFIIDKGRTDEENAVVMVEKGQYCGYGFANLSEMRGLTDELREVISPFENNPEVRRILRRFLDEKRGMRIIRF
jgi:DNA polymerase-3 subunit epsilon